MRSTATAVRTKLAVERSRQLVDIPLVTLQITSSREGFAAVRNVACERLLTGMRARVTVHVILASSRVAAAFHVAVERPKAATSIFPLI